MKSSWQKGTMLTVADVRVAVVLDKGRSLVCKSKSQGCIPVGAGVTRGSPPSHGYRAFPPWQSLISTHQGRPATSLGTQVDRDFDPH